MGFKKTLFPSAPKIKNSKWNCATNTGHIYTLKHGPESYKSGLSDASNNTKIEKEISAKIMKFSPYLSIPQESKLQHELVRPILTTFTHWNMVLKGTNYCFEWQKRTPKLSQNWVLKYWYTPPSPAECNIKTSKWNFRTNTGHICILKHGPGRYKGSLSGEKKNTRIGPELGAEIMIHSPHPLLKETSKTRNDIAGPILATFAYWNMVLEGIKNLFQGKKRTPRLDQNWVLK